VGERQCHVASLDQLGNCRSRDVDQSALVGDFRNQSFVNDRTASPFHRHAELARGLRAAILCAAEPEFYFRPDRPVGMKARFLALVFNRLVRNAVLGSPWAQHAKLREKVLERRETFIEFLATSPPVVETEQLS